VTWLAREETVSPGPGLLAFSRRPWRWCSRCKAALLLEMVNDAPCRFTVLLHMLRPLPAAGIPSMTTAQRPTSGLLRGFPCLQPEGTWRTSALRTALRWTPSWGALFTWCLPRRRPARLSRRGSLSVAPHRISWSEGRSGRCASVPANPIVTRRLQWYTYPRCLHPRCRAAPSSPSPWLPLADQHKRCPEKRMRVVRHPSEFPFRKCQRLSLRLPFLQMPVESHHQLARRLIRHTPKARNH
jgi:hypothetical protein